MPDITKCTNSRCLKKSDCYRFTSVPSDVNQAFDIFAPERNTDEDFACDMMIARAGSLDFCPIPKGYRK